MSKVIHKLAASPLGKFAGPDPISGLIGHYASKSGTIGKILSPGALAQQNLANGGAITFANIQDPGYLLHKSQAQKDAQAAAVAAAANAPSLAAAQADQSALMKAAARRRAAAQQAVLAGGATTLGASTVLG